MSQALTIDRLSVRYPGTLVLDELTLSVEEGEMMAVLGPSGSGKTTLLYAIAGFVEPTEGSIQVAGRIVQAGERGVDPEERPIGLVFQNYALWPHMTAVETVAYPMLRGGSPRDEALRRSLELLDLVEIPHLGERKPSEMSGGQQQRVGLARALAREADLYLFDEPTAHLDASVRRAVQSEIARRRRALGAAALYATHDAAEALAVADRVAILRDGAIVQEGTPGEIYERPVDVWAARLTGPASVLKATAGNVNGDSVTVGDVAVPVSSNEPLKAGPVDILVRPEWVVAGGSLSGIVSDLRFRGPATEYVVETGFGELTASIPGTPVLKRGDRSSWSLERGWVPGDAS